MPIEYFINKHKKTRFNIKLIDKNNIKEIISISFNDTKKGIEILKEVLNNINKESGE